MNINKVVLVGRVTRDPEVRQTANSSVADLTVAVNRTFGKGEDRKEETAFVDVTLWGPQAEIAGKYVKKGSEVGIEGRLTFEKWEKDGEKRSKLKVTAEQLHLGAKQNDGSGSSSSNSDSGSSDSSSDDLF